MAAKELTARGKELEALLDNPNVRTMLELISHMEGTDKHGYYTNFGGGRAESLGKHPRKSKAFTQTDGKKNKSSAFGRYQFMPKVWDEEVAKLGIEDDMSERNQDLAALSRLKMRGALDDVLAGDFMGAVNKIGNEWVSAPSAPDRFKQRKRDWDFVKNRLAAIKLHDPVDFTDADRAAFSAIASRGMDEAIQRMKAAEKPKSWMQYIKDFLAENEQDPLGSAIAEAPVGELDPLAQLAQNQTPTAPQYGSYLDPLMNLEPWENSLLTASVERDADLARNTAVAGLLGLPNVPDGQLPKAIDKAIGSIIATL